MDNRLAAIVLDSLDFGIAVLDSERRLCLTNEHARTVASRRDALCFDGDRFQILLAREQRVFDSWLACACTRPHRGEIAPFGMALPRGAGKPEYQLTVRRLDDEPARFYITVHEPAAPRSIDAQTLRQMYGLTPAEAEIAAGLFEGLNVKRLTQRLGVSANTVRTHLKSVYAKCDVGSQGQLLKLIALGPHQTHHTRTGELPVIRRVA